jgi:anti-sigma B factor antagonist
MINIEKKDKIVIISFTINKIDAHVSDEIRDEILKHFADSNSKVIIDLKGIEYIDSSGFGCFLAAMRAARNNYSTLKFANPGPRVIELLKILNLLSVFQAYNDIDSCIKSFN